MKTIELAKIIFSPDTFSVSDIPRLRGYLAKRFPEYTQIHNHTSNGGFRYVYPDIQFKYIDGNPTLVGFGSGFRLMQEIFIKVGYLEIGHRKIEISEKAFQTKSQPLGMAEHFVSYRFVTPWMALNQKNYQEYQTLNPYEREMKLNRILWGNLKSVAHAFDYWIPEPEAVKVNGHFHAKESRFKGNTMLTFSGSFITNFHIPEWLGLGKQVARGYGTVEKIKDARHKTKDSRHKIEGK